MPRLKTIYDKEIVAKLISKLSDNLLYVIGQI